MSLRLRFFLLLLTFLTVLAFPAAASAIYEVNSTGDQPDEALNGACKTAVNTCTLRAAIEEANKSEGVVDAITFAINFNGENADTISAASDLPTITDQLNILGGYCETEAPGGTKGPCAGVVRTGGGSLFVVNDDDVKIEGLAITGAANGVNVINGADGFIARNNWVGLNLKGEALGNNTGILLGPGADEAEIGGVEEEERNVIGGNSFVGLDLEGASKAKILGNFFGVAPNGTTARSNLKDIEITDSVLVPDEATENEIGQAISLEKRATAKCDGGCNVIAGATTSGIDLNGDGSGLNEEPASGPTTIRGSYVGLGGDGFTVVQNGAFGILTGASDDAKVGGTAEGETNTIVGGAYGVYGENGDNLEVLSNVIGIDKGGANSTPPSTVGIFNFSLSISGPEAGARIGLNTIHMTGGTAIEQRFTGGEIFFNAIFGGSIGILTKGASVGEGNLIEGNRAIELAGNGLLIENDSNLVIANEVEEAGEAGILVKYSGTLPIASGSTGNQIGGDEEFEENKLLFNGGPAIEIKDFEETNNEVARNNGEGNSGLFIDLVSAQFSEPNGPNEGIKPPTIANAFQANASGTAQPGATVRLFRKASAEAGELESFLGEAVADGGGAWKVTYGSSIPSGTIVAATQTSVKGGTSELTTASTTTEPGGGGNGGGGNGGNNGGGKGGAKDKTPPETKIVKGPPRKTHKRTVKFKFVSSEAGSTFQCKLDRKPFKRCSSPKKYKKLKPGKHLFKVRAIDAAGNVDPTPAKRKFTILG
jgi:CSLREA domain-containing protein